MRGRLAEGARDLRVFGICVSCRGGDSGAQSFSCHGVRRRNSNAGPTAICFASRFVFRFREATMLSSIILSMILFLTGFRAAEAELLSGFRPSPLQSKHGAVSEVRFSTPRVELEAGVLAHHLPQAMRDFRFAEPVWIIGYKTEIL